MQTATNQPWPTPTFVPTIEATNFLSNLRPTVVEGYARATEWGVQSWNVLTQQSADSSALVNGLILFALMFMLVMAFIHIRNRLTVVSKKMSGENGS